ncbi:GlsB/YeaQ/YmgE family stress response membrane protein [Streptomyces tirandamycinicus]|uniref:GlsB/YeaQ/YmgE family stress response membrane protein n=1 Tax=Streptomyces tirandamycinicus TaxID=2174846 RepID=A0A2S1SQH6_9ACTN|nr:MULTISPECIES: GlsB/YeaQ/YmgE family stress response membrane protein [Streptomyces]AWI28658.1 GlsB/YeaQ/YmgE family stress response membrane protein [Streptomyces tirandamycinicus]MCY0983449.1 GlsB/YeaQ/YmgE family stress response membrane protein [Streptomyces tirandamycinicus]MDI9887951.1 GlsB/YeaQ/YmgE family stress response membrane protein [Streptomyces sp. HNM0645]NNJ06364.1 GlsB/YeaQ/YmgE family stress response membrane protein [Streptomyces sp. PKU-MA01144]TFE54408.1 GlsB/YeaQ/YmgE 
MGWLWAIIVGFVLGLIAKAILPGKQHSPLWLITIFGIIGGIVGNALAGAFGIGETPGIDWGRHALQIIAALVVVGVGDMLYIAVRGRKKVA